MTIVKEFLIFSLDDGLIPKIASSLAQEVITFCFGRVHDDAG